MNYLIIHDIYYGRRGTNEHIKTTDEYKELLSKFCDLYDKCKKCFSKKQMRLVDKLHDIKCSLSAESNKISYIEGFKIGLLIGIECFDN